MLQWQITPKYQLAGKVTCQLQVSYGSVLHLGCWLKGQPLSRTLLFLGERERIHGVLELPRARQSGQCVSHPNSVLWQHVGSLKSVMVGVFILWKSPSTFFPTREPVVKHLPVQHQKKTMMVALRDSAQKWHRSQRYHRSHALTFYCQSWSHGQAATTGIRNILLPQGEVQ